MKFLQGIDIASVAKIRKQFERFGGGFLSGIFTKRERDYCDGKRRRFEHYAARLAAKHALLKAVRRKDPEGLDLRGIEITHLPTGKPFFRLSKKIRKHLKFPAKTQIELSLSHEQESAAAAVLVCLR